MKNILITGGAGFIGSNFLKLILEEREYNIINLDMLTYSGNLENLAEFEEYENYLFHRGDIADYELVSKIVRENSIDSIINFAAESHVDRSILNVNPFLHSNLEGTVNLLNIAKENHIERFLQISTDEVYGSAKSDEIFSEDALLKPNSPYAASKASADMFVRAFQYTHGVPAIITRSSNNFGPKQYPEKLIPLVIMNALMDRKIPVYGDGLNIRNWIYVEDNCRAILNCFENGKIGEIYNISSDDNSTNIFLIKSILKILDKPEDLINFVADRPAHDRRYAIDSSKIQNELGWKPNEDFDKGLRKTVDWYLNNKNWLDSLFQRTNFEEYYKILYRVD